MAEKQNRGGNRAGYEKTNSAKVAGDTPAATGLTSNRFSCGADPRAAQFPICQAEGLARMERAKPRSSVRDRISSQRSKAGHALLKPKPPSGRTAATGEQQDPLSVEALERGSISEVVGRVEVDIGSELSLAYKGAVLVILERHIPVQVIVGAWRALPDTILAGAVVEGTGDLRGVVAVEGSYGSEM